MLYCEIRLTAFPYSLPSALSFPSYLISLILSAQFKAMSAIFLSSFRILSAPEFTLTSHGSPDALASLNMNALHKIVQTVFQSTRIVVNHTREVQNHLHRISLLHLSDGSSIILKVSPPSSVPLLKHERGGLETEALALTLLSNSGLPVPSVLRYEKSGKSLGAPFLLTTHVRGIPLSEALRFMSRTDSIAVERQISVLELAISQHTSSLFGPLCIVSAGQGYSTWREAFKAMLESVMKDAEDMFLNLPYSHIREQVSRTEKVLDEVQDARLIVMGLGDADNVIIDERTKEVAGVIDFKQALWGDADMGRGDGATGTRGLL